MISHNNILIIRKTCIFIFLDGLVLRPEQLKGALEFHNVSFSYPMRKDAPVFQDLSLSVPAGSVMAVVGPSGSGKSTLVSLLLRLYDPDAGKYFTFLPTFGLGSPIHTLFSIQCDYVNHLSLVEM